MRWKVEDALEELKNRKRLITCSTLKKILKDLGFDVRKGKAGHHQFQHDGLEGFQGGSFNCGHGKFENNILKVPYVTNAANFIKMYKEELIRINEGSS